MKIVEPKVFLIGETKIIEEGLQAYLAHIGASDWKSNAPSDIEKLVEVEGRLCYRSFGVGLNPNITRVREDNKDYLQNIVKVRHGSVIEHGLINFIFADVSRVFTHELVRHRAGTAISQESLRFVRLQDISFWVPLVIREHGKATELMCASVREQEKLQKELAELFELDKGDKSFHYKKKVTSAMRRVAPDGLATSIGWSANMRSLRHIIEMRTDPQSEEEIRFVFGKVAEIVIARYPNLFGDYTVEKIDGYDWYKTEHQKV